MSAVFYGNVGVAALSYEPYPINNTQTTLISCQTNTSGPAIFYPFSLPGPVAVGCINLAASMSFLTAGNSSATQVVKMSYGLYSRGTGANSTTIGTMTSGIMSILATANNSSYTLSHGTSTGSNAYTYSTTASAGSNISSQYTGMKLIQLPVGLTLSAGQYWLGLFHQNSTATTTHGVAISLGGYFLGQTITALAPMGSLSSAFSTGTNVPLGIGGNWQLGAMSFTSAAQTNLPVSIALSAATQDVSLLPYMKFVSTL